MAGPIQRDHWTLRESDLPPMSLMEKNPVLQSIENNAVFRLLVWQNRSRPLGSRIVHTLGEVAAIPFVAALPLVGGILCQLLMNAVLAGAKAFGWGNGWSGRLGVAGLLILLSCAWFLIYHSGRRIGPLLAYDLARFRLFAGISPRLMNDVVESPVAPADIAAALWANAAARSKLRFAFVCNLALFAAAWAALLIFPDLPRLAFTCVLASLGISGTYIPLSRYGAHSALLRVSNYAGMAKNGWGTNPHDIDADMRPVILIVLVPVLVVCFMAGSIVLPPSSRLIWACGVTAFALLFGETWGYFVQRFTRKHFREMVADLEFVLKKLRDEPDAIANPSSAQEISPVAAESRA